MIARIARSRDVIADGGAFRERGKSVGSPFDGHRRRVHTAFCVMNTNPVVVGLIVVVCTVTMAAATIWFATDVGIPSETSVPIIVLGLFALRSATRRKTPNGRPSAR